MPTPKVNAWYGWVPDRPDYRDKLYTAIAAPPKKLPNKGGFDAAAVHGSKTRGNSAVAQPTRWLATWNSSKRKPVTGSAI